MNHRDTHIAKLVPTSSGRKRLSRCDRERHILEEAIKFFAEVGFEGQTRALAQRLGVTQPLLYRYFPSKESLIDRVYEEVYLGHWKAEWEVIIADRSLPLAERLRQVYIGYTQTFFNYEWMRLFFYSGLKGTTITDRFMAVIRDRLIAPISRELRAELDLPTPEELPPSPEEMEIAWGMHAMIMYLATRKFVYNLDLPMDIEHLIEQKVRTFMDGAVSEVRRVVPERKPTALAG